MNRILKFITSIMCLHRTYNILYSNIIIFSNRIRTMKIIFHFFMVLYFCLHKNTCKGFGYSQSKNAPKKNYDLKETRNGVKTFRKLNLNVHFLKNVCC